MTRHMKPIITATDLTKEFSYPAKDSDAHWFKNLVYPRIKSVKAVDNISFTVGEGERIAFIGPNGAGKSTTIKMLAGILFPSRGTISVLGFDPSRDRKKLAYRIGTVFGQRSQLLPNLPLTDSLEFYGVMYDLHHREIVRRTAELIEIFDLGSFIDQPVRKLSLGQRMRAEVAVSLIHEPQIIFLDEPTIGLDVVAKNNLRELLLSVNANKNTTIFLTSHDVGDIELLCDRTIVINHGSIITDIPTRDLAHSFAFEKYIDLIPHDLFAEYPSLPQGVRYVSCENTKISVSVDVNKTSVSTALQELLRLFDVRDVDVYDADMETIIRHIYEKS